MTYLQRADDLIWLYSMTQLILFIAIIVLYFDRMYEKYSGVIAIPRKYNLTIEIMTYYGLQK